jgi:hypothetical protein
LSLESMAIRPDCVNVCFGNVVTGVHADILCCLLLLLLLLLP